MSTLSLARGEKPQQIVLTKVKSTLTQERENTNKAAEKAAKAAASKKAAK